MSSPIINISCSKAALPWLARRCAPEPHPWHAGSRTWVVNQAGRDLLRSLCAAVTSTQTMARDLVLLACCQVIQQGVGNETPLWLRRALRDHVDASDVGGVGALATRCGMSREYFSRQVRRYTGYSALDLLHQARLQQAARLLRSSDQSPAHIAIQVGYRSVSAFYDRFTKQFGTTPQKNS